MSSGSLLLAELLISSFLLLVIGVSIILLVSLFFIDETGESISGSLPFLDEELFSLDSVFSSLDSSLYINFPESSYVFSFSLELIIGNS